LPVTKLPNGRIFVIVRQIISCPGFWPDFDPFAMTTPATLITVTTLLIIDNPLS